MKTNYLKKTFLILVIITVLLGCNSAPVCNSTYFGGKIIISMDSPLSKQELHNLAMNHVGKDLESRGFEFIAINSKLKKNPQFVCIDKNKQYFFVIVKAILLPENPNNYDLVWIETNSH